MSDNIASGQLVSGKAAHLAWCGLVALHLARRDGQDCVKNPGKPVSKPLAEHSTETAPFSPHISEPCRVKAGRKISAAGWSICGRPALVMCRYRLTCSA
ncbi:hypothetical protein ACB361_22460 [Escherichia coli]